MKSNEENYNVAFGERLRMARMKTGMSRKEFGAQIGVSAGGVCQYELGQRRMSLYDVVRTADDRGVSGMMKVVGWICVVLCACVIVWSVLEKNWLQAAWFLFLFVGNLRYAVD